MLASLRRIYLYLVASIALLFTGYVVQFAVYAILHNLGFSDYPGANSNSFDPNVLKQALTLLATDVVVIVPVGLLHWSFIRREMRGDPATRSGVVRSLFLALLTIYVGLTVTYSFISVAANLGARAYQFAIAGSLASAIAWTLVLAVLLTEWRASRDLSQDGRIISNVFGYIGQWILTITLIVIGIIFVQQIVQEVIRPLPLCDFNDFGNQPFPCVNSTSPTILSYGLMLVVALISLAGFITWARTDHGSGLRRASEVVLLLITVGVAMWGIGNGANLLMALILKQPNVYLPDSLASNTDTATFPFLGPLLTGGAILIFLLVRTWNTASEDETHPQLPKQLALAALSIPLAFTFLIGISVLLGTAFIATYSRVEPSTWATGFGIAMSGAAWLGLWPVLARMSNPSGTGPTWPRRIYELILLAGTVLGTAIGLAVTLYLVFSKIIGASADASGDATRGFLAGTIVFGIAAAYYIWVVRRDSIILRQQAAAVATATPSATQATPNNAGLVGAPMVSSAQPTTTSLEAILTSVATGTLTVAQAASELRRNYGIMG